MIRLGRYIRDLLSQSIFTETFITPVTMPDNNTETHLHSKLQPLTITFHLLHALAALINSLHLIVISKLHLRKVTGGSHLKVFLYSLATVDLIMAAIVLLTDNNPAQQFLAEYQTACVVSALIQRTALLGAFVLLTLAVIDRYMALVSVDYFRLFHVRFYREIVIGIFVCLIIFAGILGVAFHDVGFSLTENGGPCKMRSPEMPIFEPMILLSLPLSIPVTVISCLILYKARRILNQLSALSRKIQSALNTATVSLLALKWLTWLPIILTAIMKVVLAKKNLDFPVEVAQIPFPVGLALDPIIFGLCNPTYRKTLKRLLINLKENLTCVACESPYQRTITGKMSSQLPSVSSGTLSISSL